MSSPETKPEPLPVWRSVSLIVLVFGAIGSVGLLRHAQQHPPPILVAGFIVWVLAPFAVLAAATIFAARWPRRSQTLLHVATLIVTLGTLAIYLDDNIAHRTAKRAAVYVMVPPASLIPIGLAFGLAAWSARKRKP